MAEPSGPARHVYYAPAVSRVPGRQQTKAQIADECGEVIYVIKTDDDLIKIGHTRDIARRLTYYGKGRWDRVLVILPGTHEDEQALHKRFAQHRARAREYYHPAPEIIDFVNEVRRTYGLSEMAA